MTQLELEDLLLRMLTHMNFGWRSQFLPHERLNQAAYNRAASLRVSDETESERQKRGGGAVRGRERD